MRRLIGAALLLTLAYATGRIADEKCEEYSKLFRQKRDISSFFYNFFRVARPEKIPTQPGEFPHMAHLGFGDENDKTFACGGILISEQFVLTTATCTTVDVLFLHNRKRRALKAEHKTETEEDKEDDHEKYDNEYDDDDESERVAKNGTIKWVQFGDKSIESNLYKVEDIIIHPNHSSSGGLYNDIAIIKLDRKVEFSPDIRPACLYTKDNDITNSTVIAAGWGAPAYDQDLSDDLLKIPLTVLTEEECNKGGAVILFLTEGLDDSQFCVGGRKKPNTLCQGDGGGPLQIKNEKFDNIFDIVGLVSFGYMCNILTFPIYATRVFSFVTWIEDIVWPQTHR